MRYELFKILLLSCMIICCLQLEIREHAYYSYDTPYSYQSKKGSSSSDVDDGVAAVFAVIIIVGFIVAVGAACFFCCRALRNRTSNTREYVGNPPIIPQYGAPQNINPLIYPQPPPYYQVSNQPVQAGRPASLFSSANSPSERYRLDAPCASCSLKYKQGEEPRAMVGCQSKHIFHLSCLAFAIKLQNQFYCPQCNQGVPSTIKLFCVACKTNNATVDLSQFRNAAQGLDLDGIKRRYGECCPSCTGL